MITFGTFTHDLAVKEDVMDKEDNGVMDKEDNGVMDKEDNGVMDYGEGRNDEDIANDNVITFGTSTRD